MLRHPCLLMCPLLALALLSEYARGQTATRGQSDAKDIYGDSLPPGAISRLGTVRFRHDSTIVFAAFLPDGKSVVSAGADGVICAWEFPSGKTILRFEATPANERPAGTSVGVNGATLSPDGKHLTTFCDDGFLRIWDLANAKHLGKVANVFGARNFRGSANFSGIVYSPDGNTLMLTVRALQFVDLPSGKEIGPSQGHAQSVASITFTSDGGQIRTYDGKVVHLWNAATGKNLGISTIKVPGMPTYPTIISPDGQIGLMVIRSAGAVAGGGGPGPFAGQSAKAILFDLASGKELGTVDLGFETSVLYRKLMVFSPDSKMLAVSGGDGRQNIEFYEATSGKRLSTLQAEKPARMVKGGGGGLGAGAFDRGSRTSAQKLLFSTDGKMIAFQAGLGAAIALFDSATGKRINSLPVDETLAIPTAFSPDGRCLALEKSDGTLTVFELATMQPRRTYGRELPPLLRTGAKVDLAEFLAAGGGGRAVSALGDISRVSCAYSPDGKLLAISGPAGSVQVWDVLSGKELTTLTGHTGLVNALAFAPNGKTLASASYDTTALVWDLTKIVRPVLPANSRKPGDLETWWQELAEIDAAKAFTAAADFAAVPKEAVAWIKDRVKPVPPIDMKRIQELIKQLEDEQFSLREKATSELSKIGDNELLLPVFEKVLAGSPALETQQRLESLRKKLMASGLNGEKLRAFRAVEVLEYIGTPEARHVLQTLADGAPRALITTSAQAALKR